MGHLNQRGLVRGPPILVAKAPAMQCRFVTNAAAALNPAHGQDLEVGVGGARPSGRNVRPHGHRGRPHEAHPCQQDQGGNCSWAGEAGMLAWGPLCHDLLHWHCWW